MRVMIFENQAEKTQLLEQALDQHEIPWCRAHDLHSGIHLLQRFWRDVTMIFVDGQLADGYSYAREVVMHNCVYPSLITALVQDPEPHLPWRLCAISSLSQSRQRELDQGCHYELNPDGDEFVEKALRYVLPHPPTIVVEFGHRVRIWC